MTVDNGPDRRLGVWGKRNYADIGVRYLHRTHRGKIEFYLTNGRWCKDAAYSVDALLCNGWRPLDATATREAIRAGWREVDGKWVKDAWRWMNPYARPKAEPTPLDYEQAAKFFGEWPEDGEQPAPKPEQPKPLTPYLVAEKALREACEDARRQGQEDERRKAKPCVLKRLMERQSSDFSIAASELDTHQLLELAVRAAKRDGVDLSELAERMAGEA